MSIEEYYKKRLEQSEYEALEYARSIQERFGRKPVPADFWEEFIFFVSGNELPEYNNYVKNHIAKYRSFDDFLKAADIDIL